MSLGLVVAVQFQSVLAADDVPPRSWELRLEDETLQGSLRRWCNQVGWTLIWDADIDFPIEERGKFNMSIREALAWVLEETSQKGSLLKATLYSQNHILRIHSAVAN